MLDLHPAYKSFVSGAKNGHATYFYCRVCCRDVAMKTQGSGEFKRHFESDRHWFKDVTYRVHMGLPVLNRLMEPMEMTEAQLAEYRAKPFEDLGEEYPFPEDLVAKHSRVESKVPFMTFVGCLGELLRTGGDFSLLRKLWGHFCLSLGDRKTEFALNWSRSETVVRCSLFFCALDKLFPFLFFSVSSTCFVYRGDDGVYILVDSVPSLGSPRVVVDDQAHYLL